MYDNDIARMWRAVYLGADSRVRFHVADAALFLTSVEAQTLDLVYADAWPGKFSHLDDALGWYAVGRPLRSR